MNKQWKKKRNACKNLSYVMTIKNIKFFMLKKHELGKKGHISTQNHIWSGAEHEHLKFKTKINGN